MRNDASVTRALILVEATTGAPISNELNAALAGRQARRVAIVDLVVPKPLQECLALRTRDATIPEVVANSCGRVRGLDW